MANLDDFFAKKDKKKSKTKKFLTPEELAKKLEDTSKKAVEVKPQQPPRKELLQIEETNNSKPEETHQEHQEEEWKEFQEAEQKDYTGLKIGQLTLNDDDDELGSGQEGGFDENDTDGEGNPTRERKHGPWKAVVAAEDVTQIPVEPVHTKPNVYVPPAIMKAKTIKARNKNAPDITNEDYFPTLGAARPEEQRKKKNEPSFEEVRHGGRLGRIQTIIRSKDTPIVGNRYDSLAEEDS